MKRFVNSSIKNASFTTYKYHEFENNFLGMVNAVFLHYLFSPKHDTYFNKPANSAEPIIVASRLGLAEKKLEDYYALKGIMPLSWFENIPDESVINDQLEKRISLLSSKLSGIKHGEHALSNTDAHLRNLEAIYVKREAQKVSPGFHIVFNKSYFSHKP
ncbi:MAG: hypothetical protein ACP5N3_00705 [Candidatus Nanoarchaeia archaeon]